MPASSSAPKAPPDALADVAALCDHLPDLALYQMQVWPDHRTRYCYVSAGIAAILGWTPAQLETDPALFDANIDEADRLKIRADLARGGPHVHTVRHRRADGSPRWIKVRFQGRPQPDGSHIVTGVAEDVTEAALLDAALRSSDERFRAFMNNSPAIAWMKDEAGRYLFLNERFQRVFEVKVVDWLGKTDHDVWPAGRADEYRRNDLEVFSTNRAVEVVETVEVGPPEPGGGGGRWWVLKFPFRGPDGVRYVGGIGLDLTEREKMQGELLRANEELRASLDKVRRLESIVMMCAWTRRMRLGDQWVSVEEFLRERLGVRVSHGISDEALRGLEEELKANPWRL